ncbi:hypothetical protein BO70DRAFT_57351 [Aspergillus heteromorphus CBS 117.55]|uniref:Uncharacterized protein n=1 Tax=Aspergillus heteromorphus CBS 117.55 TaxID=1448321 RepID=A0A317VXZ7_9EURO|nr:uncharacterized protein BO70DRAFT_57351 [Aspergillus heteromorphus CBS 117.55]PWY79246.1 hypothetical protein BO70DRAFT_57351 [Aspergillus heteromorphus CBS 117.55]
MTQSSPQNNTPRQGSPCDRYILPSVEFTFSCRSSSIGRSTPTSSTDESLDPEADRRSITPTTPSLFQAMHLTGNVGQATHEVEAGSNSATVAGLAPSTTYRDLYNATPSSSGTTSAEASQRRSQTQTSTPGSLGSGVRNLTLKDGVYGAVDDQGFDSSETSASSSPSHGDENDHSYNIRREELPQAPIYDIRLQNAFRQVRGQLTGLADLMGQRQLAHDPASDLHELYKQTIEASHFTCSATRTIGFIGDSGVGKSTLINSLLDQEGLARSSGDGAACTTVVTEFRSVNEKHPHNYTVEADYMNTAEIRELLEELLSSFRKYYTDAYREVEGKEEQEKLKATAKKAWDTLRSLFPSQPGLDLEFLSREGEAAVASILTTLESWAVAGLDYRPGGRDATQYTMVAHHADECMEQLDSLMADPKEENRPAVWPFVKLIRVYLRSPILRTGLVLADLPGFRDLNYARVRATEKYLRHSCDEVFIVSTIVRCTTDESIRDIARRCAGNQPLRIVCTRSEDVDANETVRTSSVAEARPIRDLNNQIRRLEQKVRDTRTRRRKATGSISQGLALEEINLSDEKSMLELQLKRTLILRRNEWVTKSLSRAWNGNVRVFCVSNKLYSDHRDDDVAQAHEYLKLSGIKGLRRYCQSVPAEAQLRVMETFLHNQVPALIGSLNQWSLAGSDAVTTIRADVLRGVLKKAEQALQMVASQESPIYLAKMSLEDEFNGLITQTIRTFRSDWTTHAVDASQDWAAWHHATYLAFCRNYGAHKTRVQDYRCWNDEVLGPGRGTLSKQWEILFDWLEYQKDGLTREVSNTFQDVYDTIEEHYDMAPDSLQNLLLNMKVRQRSIKDAIRSSLDVLIDANERMMLDAANGHDSSYISDVMRPVYNTCTDESGPGCDARRKRAMYQHLTSPHLFAEFSSRLTSDYHNLTEQIFIPLQQRLRDEVGCVVRDLRTSVTVEGEVTEAGQDRLFTRELQQRLVRIQEALTSAQNTARDAKNGATHSE